MKYYWIDVFRWWALTPIPNYIVVEANNPIEAKDKAREQGYKITNIVLIEWESDIS